MENRSNNCKTQSGSQNNTRTAGNSRTINAASNEHKHPNQSTKGADDEGAKNAKSTKTSSKNCR